MLEEVWKFKKGEPVISVYATDAGVGGDREMLNWGVHLRGSQDKWCGRKPRTVTQRTPKLRECDRNAQSVLISSSCK